MSEDLGPLYPPDAPALTGDVSRQRIIDAKFKVVLSPSQKLARRLDRFEVVGTAIGILIVAVIAFRWGPDLKAAINHAISPAITTFFGR